MPVPALLGLSDAILGVGISAGWTVVLGIALYQYRYGDRSLEGTYMTATMAFVWFAFGFLQLTNVVEGIAEIGVVALAAASFCGSAFTGVRWWRLRRAPTDDSATA